jgi:uncharacterized protein YacL
LIFVVRFAAAGYIVAKRLSNPMVVVERPKGQIGTAVPVLARNVIQTATGRMVFASLQGGA